MALKQKGVSAGQRRGTLRWTPNLEQAAAKLLDLREPLMDEVFNRTELLRKEMQEYARENAPWGDKRADGLGQETPRARKNLFAFKQRQKSGIVVGLSHGPRTVNRGFPYGIALENFDYHEAQVDVGGRVVTKIEHTETDGEGTYAIINPTMQQFYPTVLRRLDGAFNKAIGGTGKNGGSRGFKGR